MIENQIIFKIKREHRDYVLCLAPDSPLGELFDVITQMRAEVIDKIEASNREEKKEEPKKEI